MTMYITIAAIAALVIVAIVVVAIYLSKLNRNIDYVYSAIIGQSEYIVPFTQFFADSHLYNLKTQKIALAKAIEEAIQKENFELAGNCKAMIIEMDKLIAVASNRPKVTKQ